MCGRDENVGEMGLDGMEMWAEWECLEMEIGAGWECGRDLSRGSAGQ